MLWAAALAAGGCSEPAAAPASDSGSTAQGPRAGRETSAPEVGPCTISGESRDDDPAGLRVRDAPSLEGAELGRLYPAFDPEVAFHPEKNVPLEEGLIGAQFTIDRVSGDWLHITDIDPITDGVPADGTDRRNYQGSGWVHASKVRPLPAEEAVVRERPEPQAAEVAGFASSNLYSDRTRVIDCRGNWAEVEHSAVGDARATGWLPSESNREHAETIRQAIEREGQAG